MGDAPHALGHQFCATGSDERRGGEEGAGGVAERPSRLLHGRVELRPGRGRGAVAPAAAHGEEERVAGVVVWGIWLGF
jgi:hypothetical protein